jgi:hypothetical protein
MAVLAALLVGSAAAQSPAAPQGDVTKTVDSVLSNDRFKKAVMQVSSEYERIVEEIIKLRSCTRLNVLLRLGMSDEPP